MKLLPKILIIAGSDPSGGAGLQTDIKAATKNKVYASAVPTSLTVQNTAKVSQIFTPDSQILKNQLESLFSDIKFDAIKIGMAGGFENIKVINEVLDKFAENIPVIIDPVMIATSGDELFELKNIEIFQELMIKATLITPNINEAEILAKIAIKDQNDVEKAIKLIKNTVKCQVFVKSGHLDLDKSTITNIFLDKDGKIHKITNKRVKTSEIHGTGCALATVITCNIAKGYDLLTSVKKANKYIYKQIKNSQKIGQGSKILTHF